MRSRIPLIVAVVGALLVGGATTGSTRASWTSQAPLQATSVTAGSMDFTHGQPAGVTVSTASPTQTTSFTVTDTSAGTNLVQKVSATVVSKPPGTSVTVGATCGGNTAHVLLPRGQQSTLCVQVTASGSPQSGTVLLNLFGTQSPSGWVTPSPQQVSFIVTAAPQAAFALTCDQAMSNSSYRIKWAAFTGATSYTIHSSATENGTYVQVGTGSGLSFTSTSFGGQEMRWFYIASDSGAISNKLAVKRDGSSFICPGVTP